MRLFTEGRKMKLKAASGIILTLQLIGMLTLAFNIQPVKASGTIYIRADGSFEPDTAPISSVDNITYTFTDNIYDEIVVERDNIVVDGAGYTLQGTGVAGSKGISLSRRSNVTIKNVEVKAFDYGIGLSYSSNNIISENTVTDNTWTGIPLGYSSNNIISGNSITEHDWNGIEIVSSSNNTISGNTITNNRDGVHFYWSSYHNSVSGNNITANYGDGISLSGANNSVSGNNITDNGDGIYFHGSSNNTISGNNITNNGCGINHRFESANNTIYHNNFIDNTQQVYVQTPGYTNFWDDGYPSGGNYWSDYTGLDVKSGPNQDQPGSDGVGDISYVIDGNNTDNYPLMGPFTSFSVIWEEVTHHIDTVSNSTLSDFHFSPQDKLISFDVTGSDATVGFCRVTIPKSLLAPELSETWKITIDDAPPLSLNIIEDENCAYLYFTYEHSIHRVEIRVVTLVPTIESCDWNGAKKDRFDPSEDLRVNGKGYSPSTSYDLYIVNDVNIWIDGMAIPTRIPGTATAVSSDSSGDILPTVVWSHFLTLGKYDIVVDVNGNGVYDANIDALDDSDIEVTAGFFVIPEYWLGTILGLIGCFAAFVVFGISKSKRWHL